jgi:hypothetical protein
MQAAGCRRMHSTEYPSTASVARRAIMGARLGAYLLTVEDVSGQMRTPFSHTIHHAYWSGRWWHQKWLKHACEDGGGCGQGLLHTGSCWVVCTVPAWQEYCSRDVHELPQVQSVARYGNAGRWLQTDALYCALRLCATPPASM